MLIYLGPELQSRVLPIFHYALKPGGILVLGGSETVGGFTELFEVLDKKNKFYMRTPAPSRLTFDSTPGTPARWPLAHEGAIERRRGPADVFHDADRVVLARYAPSGVVVDENLQIVQFRGDTGPYLKPAPGPPTTELCMMAREGLLGRLRDAFETARRENTSVRKEGVRVRTNDHFTEIDLEVIPVIDVCLGREPLRGSVRRLAAPAGLRTALSAAECAPDTRGRVGPGTGKSATSTRTSPRQGLTCNP